MQRYRADFSETKPDGSIHHYARWMGGPSLAKIANCRIHGADYRLTVYVTGQPYTYFSQPAATRRRGRYVKGLLFSDDEGLIFHPVDRHADRLA